MRRPLRALALTAAALLLATTWGAAPTTAQDPTPWGVMQFSMQGQPGDWVFLHHQLPENTHGVVYGVTYNFTAAAPEGVSYSALVGVPRVTSTFFKQPMESMLGAMRLRNMPAGGTVTKSYNGTEWASSTEDLTGFALLVGSTAEWNLTVIITLDDTGPTVAPSFVSTGKNMTRWTAAETYPVAPLSPHVGDLSFEAPIVTPGWTHFQLYRTHIEPAGVRAYSVDFPNHTYRMADARAGLGDEEAGYRGFTSGYPAAIGVPQDTAGTFRARIARAEATADLRMVLVHLPMAPGDIPAELQPRPYIQEEVFR